MNAIEIKKFKRFLKEEGIFKLFIRRFDPKYRSVGRWFITGDSISRVNYNVEANNENITDYLLRINCDLAIFSAFEWGSTNEGFDFWRNIHIKWADIPTISSVYE